MNNDKAQSLQSTPGSWSFEVITPEKAREYLRNNPNRRVRPNEVNSIARDIEHGAWEITHQGIAINCDGSLKDGQHRMLAVIKTGVPIGIWVYRGLRDRAMWTVDIGKNRTIPDAMGLMGLECNKSTVAIARRMMMSMRVKMLIDRAQMMSFIDAHREAIAFASQYSGFSGKRISNASIRAVIARALYTQDRARLVEFMVVLRDGVILNQDDDFAASALMRFINSNVCRGLGGSTYRLELYCKTEAALMAFLERRRVSRIVPATNELFPLPGETDESSTPY